MNSEIETAMKVFFPYAWERLCKLQISGAKLVHYCSAETALSIIQKKRVWMRNASMMNDYSEIQYGLHHFFQCWNSPEISNRLQNVLKTLGDDCYEDLSGRVSNLSEYIKNRFYITCLCEQFHADEDNRASLISCGRLSMWRAYGGQTNVALILNTDVFSSDSAAISAFSTPVLYGGPIELCEEFKRLCDTLESNLDYLKDLGSIQVVSYLINAFVFSVISLKHPGFSEEREWRVVFIEDINNKSRIICDIESICGTPQKIYKIPLEDLPGEGLTGMKVASLVHEVLIGPVNHSEIVEDAITLALDKAGMLDAKSKVRRSTIPFRR